MSKCWRYIFRSHLPDDDTIYNIQTYIGKIGSIVENWDPNWRVRPYGSVSNGFLLKGCSDVDLTILISQKKITHPYVYTRRLKEELNKTEKKDIWTYILTSRLFLYQATFPDKTDVEISFNNTTGLLNSEYIRIMAEIDSRFHKLGYYLKYFIKQSNIFENNKKLNSFSLIWMLIVFLQDVVDPHILPRIIGKNNFLKDTSKFYHLDLQIHEYYLNYYRIELIFISKKWWERNVKYPFRSWSKFWIWPWKNL